MKKIVTIIGIVLLALILAAPVMAADATYGPKVYMTDGGDRQVVADGGKIQIESGGLVEGLALKIAPIVMTAVDYTLSAAEALCSILIVTGSPSGNAIIAPTVSTSGVSVLYTVRNAGGDSASVVIKKTAGTGVTVATGKTAEVYWSGSDYVRKTPDATN